MAYDRYWFYSKDAPNMGGLMHRNKNFVHKSVPTNQKRVQKMLGGSVSQRS